jgi:hypothetical protein
MEFDAASQALVAGATSTGGDEPLLRTESADEEVIEPMDLGPVGREYINADAVTERDILILSERGGRHHHGNIMFLRTVRETKPMYRNASKTDKTMIAKVVVNYVHSYGGRFLKQDKDGRYLVMTKSEARRKTSQAFREKKSNRLVDM